MIRNRCNILLCENLSIDSLAYFTQDNSFGIHGELNEGGLTFSFMCTRMLNTSNTPTLCLSSTNIHMLATVEVKAGGCVLTPADVVGERACIA